MFFSPYATQYTRQMYAKKTGYIYGEDAGSISEKERRELVPTVNEKNNKLRANKSARVFMSKHRGFPINANPNKKASEKLNIRQVNKPEKRDEPLRYRMPGSRNPRRMV